MNNHQIKKAARELFLAGKSPDEIAELLGKGRNTIYLWASEGAWESDKARIEQVPQMQTLIIANLTKKAMTISEAEGEEFSPEKLNALALAIERFTPKKEEIRTVINIGKEFTYFLMLNQKSEARLDEFTDDYEQFIKWRLKNIPKQN